MSHFISKLAHASSLIGGIVLTILALLTSISIIGGTIASLAYSDFLQEFSPQLASWLQATGIRTIPAMYDMMEIGIAFVVFSFLPITSLLSGHAVVDVFTNLLPPKRNQFLITIWESVFFIILALITWRLFLGMERFMTSNGILIELNIPQWWSYAVAFVQMILASFVGLYVAYGNWVKLLTGREILPTIGGAIH